ncbi:MAG TPA: Trp family transcriptional regulator [Bdellovibrionota bacterium]|nr:Trp family transcriptional regulator [Bdellovibrionota bacterium]
MKSYVKQLRRIFTCPKSPEEMEDFIEDFMSPSEVRQFVERWLIAELLLRGQSQRKVKQNLGVSISKVSRCANVVNYGNGAFRRTFLRLHPKTTPTT